MTLEESINRGFNLMVTVFLFFSGLAMGANIGSPVENDWGDRFDDIGLLVIAIIAVVWYLIGRNRYKRSAVPLILTALAVIIQLAAIPLERDDPAAFGDNIIGLIMLIPFFIFVLVNYLRLPKSEPMIEQKF
jgi:hypothetical protein